MTLDNRSARFMRRRGVVTGDKHEEILSRMGAILSTGIINSAGRNATISLATRDGNIRHTAITGLVLFM